MKNNTFSKICLLGLALLATEPTTVWAEGAHHGPTLTIMWINFIIFAAGMFFVLKKPLVQVWKTRVADLETSILKSERELAKAEERLTNVKSKVANVAEEVAKVQANINEETKHERARISELALEQKTRILKQAEVSVESEIKAVEKSVKSEFAEKVCAIAKDRLKQEFTTENDRTYRSASLEGLNSLIKNKNV